MVEAGHCQRSTAPSYRGDMSPSRSTRFLGDLRWPQIADHLVSDSVLIQPVGAIEQHGPHLPLNTDYVIGDAVAQAVVERFGDELDLWLLPTLAYSKSNEHVGFPGSIWLSASTMLSVLDDLGRSLALLPTDRLAFLNAHGGNSALLAVANRDIRMNHQLRTFLTHPGVPPDQGGPSAPSESGMGVHGGHDETSIMLYLRPELVDMDVAVRNVPDKLADNDFVRFGGTVAFGWLSSDFGSDGHIGDPTTASAEHGKFLFEGSVEQLGRALAEVRSFDHGR